MILIADSGSTKTTWMEVESGNKLVTEGLNPHFTTDEAFFAACNVVRRQLSLLNAQCSIYFYGSGCGSESQSARVESLLAKAFGTSQVHVETDMLGACRAVCGGRPGVVGILGTGSNACYYNGRRIAYQAISTGYILGDPGSANHVGRLLLNDYLTGRMPYYLATLFHESYPLTNEQFMDAVYHQPYPNRFLASLAPFALQNEKYDYCSHLVFECLKEWYFQQVAGAVTFPSRGCKNLSIVGSFGAAIGEPMERFAKELHLVIRKRLSDPMDGLRQYHIKKI